MPSAHTLINSWSTLYRTHDSVQIIAALGHILAVCYAARFALIGDRAALRLAGSRRPRTARDLRDITSAHKHVIGGLCFALLTGLAQLLAQLDYLPYSPFFWCKMLALALLLANGRIIQVAGRRLSAAVIDSDANAAPSAPVTILAPTAAAEIGGLRNAALRSIMLWSTLVVLGLLLTTVQPQ